MTPTLNHEPRWTSRAVTRPARSVPVALALAFAFASPALALEEFDIGSRGATLSLNSDWKRTKLVQNMGDDQFVHFDGMRQLCLMVQEYSSIIDTRSDMERHLAIQVGSMAAMATSVERGEFSFARSEGAAHGITQLSATVDNFDIVYEVHLVSRDGLGYFLTFFSSEGELEALRREARLALEELRFPPSSSEWARGNEVRSRSLRVAGHTVRFRTRDSIFGEVGDVGDALLSLMSPGAEIAVHFLLLDGASDLNEASSMVATPLGLDGGAEIPVSESTLEVSGRKGRQAFFHDPADDGTSYQAVLVPLADDAYLDLRIIYDGSPDRYSEYRDMIVESLEIEAPPTLDAFPVIAVPKGEPQLLCDAQVRLLSGARLLGVVEESPRDFAELQDGRIAVASMETVTLIDPADGTVQEHVIPGELHYNRSLAAVGNRLLTTSADGTVVTVGGATRGETIQALRIGSFLTSGEFLVARRVEPLRLAGLLNPGQQSDSALSVAGGGGRERLFRRFDDRIVEGISVDGGKTAVLVSTRNSSPDTSIYRIELRAYAADGREQDWLSEWDSITSLRPADQGWLVTGSPVDADRGVFRITPDGKRELLVAGAFARGISIREDQLCFASSLGPPGTPEGAGTFLFLAPLDLIRQEGRKCEPFAQKAFSSICETACAKVGIDLESDLFPTTLAVVERLAEVADALALERTGSHLPATPRAVDQLINQYSGELVPGRAGRAVLSALLFRSLLAAGAEWVEASGRVESVRNPTADENHFAVSFVPSAVLRETADEYGDWWSPATSIVARANGRTIFLGEDRPALRHQVAGKANPSFTRALENHSADVLETILLQAAGNIHAREAAYKQLARHDLAAEMEKLAGAFIGTPHQDLTDLRALHAARLSKLRSYDDPTPLIVGLRQAIVAHPEDALLFYLLGEAYSLSSDLLARQKARMCYEKALEITPWGGVAGSCQKGLSALELEDE